MPTDSPILRLLGIPDSIGPTEVLRNGACALLAQAVEAEVAALLSCHADKLTADGRQRLVRHGHLPEREIMTGVGPVAVRCPRLRDRVGEGSERIQLLSCPQSAGIINGLGILHGRLVSHTDASRGDRASDIFRLIGPVDAVERVLVALEEV
jgi:hypothetical protein